MHLSQQVIVFSDNPTELTHTDVNDVNRTLLANNGKTIFDVIEGENKFGTGPKMYGAFKSSLIDLEALRGDRAEA